MLRQTTQREHLGLRKMSVDFRPMRHRLRRILFGDWLILYTTRNAVFETVFHSFEQRIPEKNINHYSLRLQIQRDERH
jgi:hypothetical protein